MNFQRRIRLLSAGKSPSTEAMKRTYKRAVLNGGVTVDFSANVERIREVSRTLNYNILQDAIFVYTPSSYGESRNYTQNPYLSNLFKYSDDYTNSNWIGTSVTVTPNTISNPIEGTVNVCKLVEGTANSTHSLRQNTNISLETVTMSVYAKSAERTFLRLGRAGAANAIFDVTNGTLVSSSSILSYNIIPISSGWYKLSIALGNTVNAFVFDLCSNSTTVSYTGDGVSGMYLYRAVIELGNKVTSDQRTTDGIIDLQHTRATTSNVTQKDGSIGDGCYNLIPNSEDLNNATFTNSNITVTTNTIASPIGTLTADTITSTSATSSFASYIYTGTIIPTTQYMFGFYIKNNNSTISRVYEGNTTATLDSAINWSGSVISSITNTTGTLNYISVGDGWYLVYGIVTNVSGQQLRPRLYPHNGTSGESIYTWGWQLTLGSDLKPYLKTTNRLNVPSYDYSLSNLKASDLIQPQRTNILLNSATGTTQTRTVTAQVYTLSFYGTGSYTLSGVATGTLTGTGVSNLVTLTFTPTAGSLVLTVSGSITEVQLEAGPNATSRIRTTSASVTRNGDTSFVDLFNMNMLNKNNFTLYVEGFLKQNVATNIMVGLSDTTGTGARANDIGVFDGIKATYANASTISSDTFNLALGLYYRIAIQRNGTTVKFFRNGSQKWVTQTIPVFDYRYLFVNNGGSTFTVDKIALFNKSLTDMECVNLTNTGIPDLPPSVDLLTNLVAYYKFDSNTNESTGLSPNGVPSGIDYVVGKTGNAARFDSVTDYVDISDTDNLSFTNGTNDIPFSISMWIYPTALNNTTVLINKTGLSSNEWMVFTDTTGSISVQCFDKSNTSTRKAMHVNSAIVLNTWQLLTVTVGGSTSETDINVYINSVIQSKTSDSIGTYTSMINTTNNTRIGQLSWSDIYSAPNETKFTGYMEEVGVWKNRILTQAEITYLYNSGNGITYPF